MSDQDTIFWWYFECINCGFGFETTTVNLPRNTDDVDGDLCCPMCWEGEFRIHPKERDRR